jgi:hypothetical protein
MSEMHRADDGGTGGFVKNSASSDGYPNACPNADLLSSLPTSGEVAARPSGSDRRPFVAQSGKTIYLVTGDAQGWVVAELEFDPDSCLFVLRRQGEYQWPREALGRILSRLVVTGSLDEANRLADAFSAWVAGQFAA